MVKRDQRDGAYYEFEEKVGRGGRGHRKKLLLGEGIETGEMRRQKRGERGHGGGLFKADPARWGKKRSFLNTLQEKVSVI